ncbi:Transcriptional Regulator, Fis family protein [Fulvimarina pelagi HTCC2506]|uniref:Transcriptional Regulator, Fis family protein n=1 Tax=Fulvimarina pelagi HTCC2506 TaxID=314231 RepID=Q0FYR2_9HYPH|nr:transcriptional regulator PpsR [Fulvimarina pelagi]EAU40246.1 Transcriptional Regulator, Fis family protein [Fulvimarina pelagi HTCC2506]
MGVNFAEGGRAFSDPDRTFANLDPGIIASLVTATADFALLIDDEGKVVDVAMRQDVCPPEVYHAWIGRAFIDTVTSECRLKAKRLLADVADRSETRREINHPVPDSPDLPVSYVMLPLARAGGRVALGRDLRAVADLQQRLISAQLAYDHEFEQVRSVEAQYRVLFETSAQFYLIVDPKNRTIIEANAVARKGLLKHDAVGSSLESLFAADTHAELDRLIATAFSSGKSEHGTLRHSGPGNVPATVSLRFFRHLGSPRLSVQIEPGGTGFARTSDDLTQSLLSGLGATSPDAIVIFDEEMRVVLTNQSYLDLVQVAELAQLRGQQQSDRIGQRGVEMRVLKNAIDNQGIVRTLTTYVTTAYGGTVPVDIGGTAFSVDGRRFYGLVIRRNERTSSPANQSGRGEMRPANDMIGLVGQMPLRDIVRDTTDIIERLCIEAALELTQNNRASAAELLGISRQALYTKLRRFGIIGEAG